MQDEKGSATKKRKKGWRDGGRDKKGNGEQEKRRKIM
jgi:hypothetical protein